MFENLFKKGQKNAAAPEGERIYAIGDIHGCLPELNALMVKIEADAAAQDGARAQFVFLGDYVDRGPDVKGVIDRLIDIRDMRPETIFLKGNHEAALMDFLDHPEDMTGWLDWGGRETLKSYGAPYDPKTPPIEAAGALAAGMPQHHLDFIRSLSLYHEAEDYLFVHAGLRPGRALAEQHEQDLLWIRNVFNNAAAHERPDRVVVHGHQPYDQPLDKGWRIGVDTGVYYSGRLSAVVLEGETRRFITASA